MPLDYPAFSLAEVPADQRTVDQEREHRRRMCALGYRIFGALRWGQLGDGHISARDPELTDHFWLLDYGIPFSRATVGGLILVGPDGTVVERGAGASGAGGANVAGYHIHFPLLRARPEVVSAAHTHTGWGTPFSAQVRPFEPISQESCAFVFNQSMFDDEELEIASLEAGDRIAAAAGDTRLCVLRNHGLLTLGETVEQAVGFFVMAERVAEVHVKAGRDAKPISTSGAKVVAAELDHPLTGDRMFQWLVRDLVPDLSVID